AICIHQPRWPLGTPTSTRREPPRTCTAASRQTMRATSPPTDDERECADHPTQQLMEHPRQRNTTRPGAQLRTMRHRLQCERASERCRRGKAVEGKEGEGGRWRARTAPHQCLLISCMGHGKLPRKESASRMVTQIWPILVLSAHWPIKYAIKGQTHGFVNS
ncbi:hypothetical protein BJ912DRAFT_1093150, partial [Pholiota molesta]